jgi:hypothetical protein
MHLHDSLTKMLEKFEKVPLPFNRIAGGCILPFSSLRVIHLTEPFQGSGDSIIIFDPG